MHARGVVPKEEGLPRFLGLLHEVDRLVDEHLVKGGHVVFGARSPFTTAAVRRASGVRSWRQRSLIDDLLLADRTPAGLDS